MSASRGGTPTPMPLRELSSTPTAPPAGTLAVYPKTDHQLYTETSAGVETLLGSATQRTFAYFVAT